MTTLPPWLESTALPIEQAPRQLALRQFEIIFPTVLERMAEGSTLAQVFKEDHRDLSVGAFTRWIYADPGRAALYREAKEIRSEAWAGQIIDIAEAVDNPLEDVARSKLKIDTYKFLMGADNRRTYGDTKTIDVGGSISISAALAAATSRAVEVIDMDAPSPTSSTPSIEYRTVPSTQPARPDPEDQTADRLALAQRRAYDAMMASLQADE